MLFQSENHLKSSHKDHMLTGALRSGQGSQSMIQARVDIFEEREMLDALEE